MVKETWSHGRPTKIQKQLGNTFQTDFLLDLIENLNVGKMSCLNFSPTEIDSLGLNPFQYENVNSDTRKAHKRSCGTRKDRIPSIQCFLCFHCIMCGQMSKDQNEFEDHLRNCLSTALPVTQGEQGEASYACHICGTEQMDFKASILHLTTFCCRNFKEKCPFCQQVVRKCSCTVQRLNLMDVVRDKISKGKQLDLFNHFTQDDISFIYFIQN